MSVVDISESLELWFRAETEIEADEEGKHDLDEVINTLIEMRNRIHEWMKKQLPPYEDPALVNKPVDVWVDEYDVLGVRFEGKVQKEFAQEDPDDGDLS